MNRRDVKAWREVYLGVCANPRLGLTPNARQYRRFLIAAMPKGTYPVQYENKPYPRTQWIMDRCNRALK